MKHLLMKKLASLGAGELPTRVVNAMLSELQAEINPASIINKRVNKQFIVRHVRMSLDEAEMRKEAKNRYSSVTSETENAASCS